MLSHWRARLAALVAGFALLAAAGCASGTEVSGAPTTSTGVSTTSDLDTVDFTGLPDLKIGARLPDLLAAGVVARTEAACGGVEYPRRKQVSPIFDGDQLVLIWADPPLHTPDGVMVGSSLDTARSAYSPAVELTRPAGSAQFPALLVSGPEDRAYLLLHDGMHVQKLIVGIERYAQAVFDTGFGTC